MSWWTSLVVQAATVLTGAAIVITGSVWVRTRSWQPTVPVLLDLLLAAGLLRLSVTDDWRTIAGAAAIVAIRTTIRTGVRLSGTAAPASPGPHRSGGGSA